MGGEKFAYDGNSDEPEEGKRFQLWKHSRRKKRQVVHALLKTVRVVHGDSGTCIVSDNVPLLDPTFYADLFDVFGKDF
jgi:hypothetical protein